MKTTGTIMRGIETFDLQHVRRSIDRCLRCAIPLDEHGACPQCGYKG